MTVQGAILVPVYVVFGVWFFFYACTGLNEWRPWRIRAWLRDFS